MYTLIRKSDGLKKKGPQISWIEWNEDGTFNTKHDAPAVGRSLILDPQRMSYTWLTTTVTEILESAESGYVHFNTKNSEYILIKD